MLGWVFVHTDQKGILFLGVLHVVCITLSLCALRYSRIHLLHQVGVPTYQS